MVEQCMYLGDHMQLKVCCNRCNHCSKDRNKETKDEVHSILLKSSVQTWKPGDTVRFRLKNFRVNDTNSKEVI